MRLIFGDIANCGLAMDLRRTWLGRNLLDYLLKLHDGQARLNQGYSRISIEKSAQTDHGWWRRVKKVVEFQVGNYVLLKYPNRPPNKLAGLYRGPLIIVAIERPNHHGQGYNLQ